MRDIGKNIRDLRLRKNMTQEELGERLFVTRQTVSNYETGKSRPDLDMLMSIAQVLGTDINAVIYGPPSAAERERRIRRLIITVVCLAALGAIYWHLAGVAEDLAYRRYEIGLSLAVNLLFSPLVYGLLGWTVMETAMFFGGLKPLRGRTARATALVLGLVAGVYLLMVAVQALPGLEWMRRFTSGALLTLLNLRGIFNCRTCAAILGGALRLTVPEKTAEEEKM